MAAETITATGVKMSSNGRRLEGTAGGTVTRGQPIALDPVTSKYVPADSSDSDLHKVVGIALNDAGLDQPVDYVVRDAAFEPGFTPVLGTFYALGINAGEIEKVTSTFPASADYGVIIGVGLSSTIMPVDFSTSNWGGLTP